MKRHLASLLLSLPLAAGCGDASSTDAPSDAAAVTDVVSLPDAPSLLDAPASIDVPAAIDAGSTSDTPSSAMPEVPPPPPPPPVDVPVAMADVPPPPPPPPPVMACIATAAIGNGGGTCSGIDQAFSARGINAGYYPFRVLRPIVQFSGDHDGDGATVFSAGPRRRGVVLQTIPAGVYVGLSTVPGNYDPPTGCDVATCGNPSRAACGDSSPALRAPVAGFY